MVLKGMLVVFVVGCADARPADAAGEMEPSPEDPRSPNSSREARDASVEPSPHHDSGSVVFDAGLMPSAMVDAGRPLPNDAGPVVMSPAGLVAAYSFAEAQGDVIHDTSGSGAPLSLLIHRAAFVERVPHGLRFSPPAAPRGTNWNADKTTPIVRSPGPATKIIEAIKRSGAFSVEMWLKPSVLSQDGPSRLVALARENYVGCNVQVAHGPPKCGSSAADSYFHVRLLRPAGEGNGCEAIGGTPRLKPEAQHFVLTQDTSGEVSVFLDGSQVATERRPAGLTHWSNDAALGLGNLPYAPGAPDDAHSNGRAWSGELYYVAWYSSAMSAAQIAALARVPYQSR